MASIKLEIVSPDRVVYSDDIAMLIVRSTGGRITRRLSRGCCPMPCM